ncbi:MAG: site-2 protease family protein [Acidobacteria bacterium]|nr:site-2 protease family protein [Acidobacteriota bacterium]
MSENELEQVEADQNPAQPFEFYSVHRPERTRPRILVPAMLFGLTIFTTLLAGIFMQVGFLRQAGIRTPALTVSFLLSPEAWWLGIPFSVTLLAILMAHEMGHFLMCRYYGIDATYPYVLPAPPLLNPFGTFGAVIRIKSPFGDSRQLFDVGVAGPLAGFAVLMPALIIGLNLSTVYRGTITSGAYEFGEPFLFRWLSRVIFADPNVQINLHPVGFAAWFGMLATSLNLLPIGQLDGGHLAFAIAGPKAHRWISGATLVFLVLISLSALPMPGYLLFGMVLVFIGLKHPRPLHEGPQIGGSRTVLALLAVLIFIITFIVVPVRVL